MTIRKAPAGLVDAGSSSLATFVAGIAATRLLGSAELGAYAIFFSAWLLASQLAAQLILVPAEAKLVQIPSEQRKAFLLRNSLLALPMALLGSAMVVGVLILVPSDIDFMVAFQLGVTAALVAGLFPLQEHARRLLHLSRSHWPAAWVSLIRLAATSIALGVGWSIGIDSALLPFGSLAAGDFFALAFTFLIVRPERKARPGYKTPTLIKSGKWLLLSASLGPAAGFVVSLLVTHLANAAALGLAEAARIAAQPVLVLAVGLAAVLRPTSMEAASKGDRSTARRTSRRLGLALTMATVVYMAALFLPESLNPLKVLVPKAFVLAGLVHLSVAAAFFNGVVFLHRAELIAVDRTRAITRAEVLASFGRTIAAVPAGTLRSWVVPIGFVVGGIIRWVSFSSGLRTFYTDFEPRSRFSNRDSSPSPSRKLLD